MRLIDADALVKDGWTMHRTVRVDKDTMSYETKKPTDFPTIEPERKTGKWICVSDGLFEIVKCDQCGQTLDSKKNFCPNCGADMREEGDHE